MKRRRPDPTDMAIVVEQPAPATERRVNGLLRVPFVRRCQVEFDGGPRGRAAVLNINVLGAYVALGDPWAPGDGELAAMPAPGQTLVCRFRASNAETLELRGVVAWLRPRQQHLVHSLPPGFGMQFSQLDDGSRYLIERVIERYVDQHPELLE